VLTNAALDTTNAAFATMKVDTNTRTTPLAPVNASLAITSKLPRIQSSSRSYTRMPHSTPRVKHSCSRRNCPVLNHVAEGQLLSSLSTPTSTPESNGCKTVRQGGIRYQLSAVIYRLPATSFQLRASSYPLLGTETGDWRLATGDWRLATVHSLPAPRCQPPSAAGTLSPVPVPGLIQLQTHEVP